MKFLEYFLIILRICWSFLVFFYRLAILSAFLKNMYWSSCVSDDYFQHPLIILRLFKLFLNMCWSFFVSADHSENLLIILRIFFYHFEIICNFLDHLEIRVVSWISADHLEYLLIILCTLLIIVKNFKSSWNLKKMFE